MSLSVKNSSNVPLLSGTSFEGQVEDVLAWSSLYLSFKADTNCTVSWYFSQNVSNMDFSDSMAVSAGTSFFTSVEVKARFMKVVVENTGADQTYLRLQSILRKEPTNVTVDSMPNIDVTLSNATSSVLAYGFDGTNNQKLSTTNAGVLKVDLQDSSLPVTQSGSWTVDANTTLSATTSSIQCSGLYNNTTQKQISVNSSGNVQVELMNSLANSTSSVQVYGFDGSDNVAIATDNNGYIKNKIVACDLTLGTADARTTNAYRNLNLGTTSSQVGSTSQTALTSLYIMNNATSKRYVKLYNLASATDSDTPSHTYCVPSEQCIQLLFPVPLLFNTSLCLRGTCNLSDSDNTAPSANDLIINLTYAQ